MTKFQLFDYKQVARYRAVQNRVTSAMPFATQIIVTDGGPWAEHNVVCAVCGENGAILNLHEGIFIPCDGCTKLGWSLSLKQVRNYWWQFWRPRG